MVTANHINQNGRSILTASLDTTEFKLCIVLTCMDKIMHRMFFVNLACIWFVSSGGRHNQIILISVLLLCVMYSVSIVTGC